MRSRILFVVDDGISIGLGGFGIGRVLALLAGARLGSARFDVKVAARYAEPGYHPEAGLHEATYTGFRFDQRDDDGELTISRFDQIWCYGLAPGNNAPDNLDPAIDSQVASHPWYATDGELGKLAAWMDAGGGLFGTGDHHYLGASMCARIPRLGLMRRWTVGEGVPTMHGTTRLDTNRPRTPEEAAGTTILRNTVEGDATPQRIEWVAKYSFLSGPFREVKSPHEILCHPQLGPIDMMPDHPHEGRCYDPRSAAWITAHRDATFAFPGYGGEHFPTNGVRPLPEVIAWGHTLADPPIDFEKGDQAARRFPMVSAYDGQQIGIGRVVTDSTWHHHFDMNLDGIAAGDPVAYDKISRYFINIGVYLASSAFRRAVAIRPLLTSRFEYFGLQERAIRSPLLQLGRDHLEYLKPRVGPCWVRSFLWDQAVRIDPEIRRLFEHITRPRKVGCLSCPPLEVIEAAMMGGIARVLFADERELDIRQSVKPGPYELDSEEVEARLRVGLARGLAELGKLYAESDAEAKQELALLSQLAQRCQ